MRFASRVEPPFSGKNASGSVCEHRARSCHSGALPNRSATTGRPSISVPPSCAPAAEPAQPPTRKAHVPLVLYFGAVFHMSRSGDLQPPVRTSPVKLHACNACVVKPNLLNRPARAKHPMMEPGARRRTVIDPTPPEVTGDTPTRSSHAVEGGALARRASGLGGDRYKIFHRT